MHCLDHLFALGPLLWMFSLLLPSTTASPSHPSTSQLPFQIARDTFHADSRQSWFNLARDNVIQTIWRVPAKGSPSRTLNKPSISSSPPPTVLARYGGDLVLRFEISSIEQVEALAEAIDVLFLDVWEFTAEWVDIRLSKDVVSLSNRKSVFARPLLISAHLGTLLIGTSTALPPTRTHTSDARPCSSYLWIIPIHRFC